MAGEINLTRMGKPRAKSKGKAPQVTVQLVNKVCDEIAQGVTLTEICARPGMPAIHQFYKAVNRSSSLRSRLACAREDAAERLADELKAIADEGHNDYMERTRPNGQKVEVLNDEHVRRSDLRIRTRQWLLSKMMPDRWGDRVQTQLTGAGGGPVQVEHSLSASMLANLARLRERLPASVQGAMPVSGVAVIASKGRKQGA